MSAAPEGPLCVLFGHLPFSVADIMSSFVSQPPPHTDVCLLFCFLRLISRGLVYVRMAVKLSV